jgi:capsular polysaccharide biosynthesis protein
LKDGDTFEVADVRMEFQLRDEPADATPNRMWRVVLGLVAIVILAIIIIRMRG